MSTTIKPAVLDFGMYSDLHKDVYGFRPRGNVPKNRLELVVAMKNLQEMAAIQTRIEEEIKQEQAKVEAERVAKIRARNNERKALAGSWFSRLLEEAK